MIVKNDLIKIPMEENKILKKFDEKFKKEDSYFIKYNKRTHEVFIIHSIEKPFVAGETIQIKEILGVAMSQYKSTKGKFFKNNNIYVKFEHYKYDRENRKCISNQSYEERIADKSHLLDGGTMDYLDPDLLDF